jgi:hypothetical protein
MASSLLMIGSNRRLSRYYEALRRTIPIAP